jgi:phosphate transport system substrate-binding protein
MFSKKLIATVSIVAIIAISALMLGCTSPSPSATPTVAGSPTSAPITGSIQVTGSTSVGPYTEELATMFEAKYPGTQVGVSQVGSGPGIQAVIDGTTDIGMSSRALTDAETAKGLKSWKICDDGVAVILNNNNALVNLSTTQIRDIFAGNVTNWKQVGGSDATIVVVTREAGSGTRDAFQTLIMGKPNITASAIQQSSTGAVMTYVSGNPNAIGYISFGSLDRSVKALQVDGVAPSIATIKDKTYKPQRPFLYVTRGDPTNAVAKAFIDYTLGSEGQAYLAKNNLVTL